MGNELIINCNDVVKQMESSISLLKLASDNNEELYSQYGNKIDYLVDLNEVLRDFFIVNNKSYNNSDLILIRCSELNIFLLKLKLKLNDSYV